MKGQPVRSQTLVLASASPRRRELLTMLGCSFEVVEPDIDEKVGDLPDAPERQVESLAQRKAGDVGERRREQVVIAADTIVVLDGEVLGKPRDEAEAVSMLQRLSGGWHQVYTGVAVKGANTEEIRTAHRATRVKFRELHPSWVKRYVQTGEPMDKAGAYGIQGRGSLFVAEIQGCYFTVVGLPLALLSEMLEYFGVTLL